MTRMDDAAARIIRRFDLQPHPEGGFFREIYRSQIVLDHPAAPAKSPRNCSTLIYYLLSEPQFSAFHRVKWSDEIWHLYAGGPLELHLIDDQERYRVVTLTSPLADGEPSAVVPAGWWQAARLPAGTPWAFGGCTVAPGFDFADFEMPQLEELVERFPQHEEVLRPLARR